MGAGSAAVRESVMARSFFYGTDAELLLGSAAFAAKILSDPEAYGLDAAAAQSYATLDAAWAAAYRAAIDPETRTRPKVAAKDAARARLMAEGANLRKRIEGTAGVTDEQRIDLGLVPRVKPTRIGRPTERPRVSVASVLPWTVTVEVNRREGRGREAGAAAAWVYACVGDAMTADAGAWEFRGAVTRGRCDLEFAPTIPAGTPVWVRAAWVNRRGEMGPMSEPVMTHLQLGVARGSDGALKIAA